MELLLEIILEPFFFAYFDLAERIFDGKKLKKRQENFLKILCVCVSFVAVMLVLIGGFWIADKQPFKTYGTVMLVVGSLLLLAHILIAFLCGGNRTVEDKDVDEENDSAEDLQTDLKDEEPSSIVQYIELDEIKRKK
ncbi:MAG: hypothetical protein IJB97_10940 [Clostridia bacterium]|nr:hypothetical protein [Clostridia bacterium]